MTGQDLAVERKARGWTQQQLAHKLGVSQSYVALLEAGRRPISSKLQEKAVRGLKLDPVYLPVPPRLKPCPIEAQQFAADLAALGYPGFAHMKGGRLRNPAELVLLALGQEDLRAPLAEALPWVLLNYVQIDHGWLVDQARLQQVQNRLGFVVSLALQVAVQAQRADACARLEGLRRELEQSRLMREDTLAENSLSQSEREWLRKNRPPEAEYWNLLTNWQPEHLQFAAA